MAQNARGIPSARFVEICCLVQSSFKQNESFGYPVDVMKWKDAVEQHLSKPSKKFEIEILGFDLSGQQIKGQLIRYKTGAKVFHTTSKTVSHCWQRYIVAKELAHLLIDSPEDYTRVPSSLMSQLITGIPLWKLREDPYQDQRAFESEKMAIVGAIEMLLPWKFRGEFSKMCDKGMDTLEIAKVFKVPRHVVANMLTPMYGPLSEIANKKCS